MNPSNTLLEEMARELGIDADKMKTERFFKLIKATVPVYLMNLTRKTAPYGGDIVSNMETITLVNNVALNYDFIVPAGKRWYLWGGKMMNGDDVNRNCSASIYDADANKLMVVLRSQAIVAGNETYFPNTEASVTQLGSGAYPVPLLAGWYVRYYFAAGGASAGGDAENALMVVEVEE